MRKILLANETSITIYTESLQQIDIQYIAYLISYQKIFEDFNYQFE